ncbi:MAG: DMT family transporter [Chloroflexi bacterium]|nr:DMT family transporter [Chloroflexota bacterium]
MSWVDIAILGTAVLSMVNVLESHILYRRVPRLPVYLLAAAPFHTGWGLLLLYLFPFPDGGSAGLWLAGIAGGALRAGSVTFMLYAMRREDVSQVVPVVFTYPVFVAIMAMPLLGETLSYLQWLAIIVVVAGAMLVSVKRNAAGSASLLGKAMFILLGASLMLALADIISKYALSHFTGWNMFSFTAFSFAAIFLSLALRRTVAKEIFGLRGRAVTAIVSAQVLAPAGITLSLLAMEMGPISLVSTILGSRPLFVALYGLAMSYFWPKFMMRSASSGLVALRFVATGLVVGGISLIYLLS